LDAERKQAVDARPPPDRPLRRHGPHALGLPAPGGAGATVATAVDRSGTAPAHLLLKPGEEGLDVDLFGWQNPCRSRGFLVPARHPRIIAGACYGNVSNTGNARGGTKAPARANCLRREVEHGLQLLRSLLELVAP